MSASTTPNSLTNEQELIVREFIEKIVEAHDLWSQNSATRRSVGGACVKLLGYSSAGGVLVPAGTQVTKNYFGGGGNAGDFAGLYDKDGLLVRGALDATDNDNSPDETDTSEPTEGDAVGDVLLEDV